MALRSCAAFASTQAPEAHVRRRADAVMSGLGKATAGEPTQPTITAPINADADDFMIELPLSCRHPDHPVGLISLGASCPKNDPGREKFADSGKDSGFS